jgi:hypothetical protein
MRYNYTRGPAYFRMDNPTGNGGAGVVPFCAKGAGKETPGRDSPAAIFMDIIPCAEPDFCIRLQRLRVVKNNSMEDLGWLAKLETHSSHQL